MGPIRTPTARHVEQAQCLIFVLVLEGNVEIFHFVGFACGFVLGFASELGARGRQQCLHLTAKFSQVLEVARVFRFDAHGVDHARVGGNVLVHVLLGLEQGHLIPGVRRRARRVLVAWPRRGTCATDGEGGERSEAHGEMHGVHHAVETL
jgi:hypothetical protein